MSDIEEVFTGDSSDLVEALQQITDEATEAADALDRIRNAFAELDGTAEAAEEAAEELDSIRDAAAEAEQAVDSLSDSGTGLDDIAAQSQTAAEGLARIRDDAGEAEAALDALVASGPGLDDIAAFAAEDGNEMDSLRNKTLEAAGAMEILNASGASAGARIGAEAMANRQSIGQYITDLQRAVAETETLQNAQAGLAASGYVNFDDLAEDEENAEVAASNYWDTLKSIRTQMLSMAAGESLVVGRSGLGWTLPGQGEPTQQLAQLLQEMEQTGTASLLQQFLSAGQAASTWETDLSGSSDAIGKANPLIESQAGVLDDVAAAGATFTANVRDELAAMQAFSDAWHAYDASGSWEDLVRLGQASQDLDTALSAASSSGEDFTQVFGGVDQATQDVAQGLLDSARAAGQYAFAQGAAAAGTTPFTTGIKLLDDAMAKAGSRFTSAGDAAGFLKVSLSDSEDIAKDARVALLALGASEQEAAAGANALANAQSAADAALGSGGGVGILSKLFGFAGGGGEGGFSVGGLLGNMAWFTGGAAAIMSVASEMGALVAGASAAITGIVPAVALAIPAFEELKNGYEEVTKAQAAYKAAAAKAGKDPTTANLDAEAKALKKVQDDYKSMGPAETGAITGIARLKSEYDSMAKAFEPDVFGIFNRGIRVAEELLPTFKPLAEQAAGGIDDLLDKAEKFFKIPKSDAGQKPGGAAGRLADHIHDIATPPDPTGWQKFLEKIKPDIKPAEEAIGEFGATVIGDWGKFIERFSPKDIQNAFHILGNLVNWWSTGWGRAISHAMNMWDDFSAAAKNVRNWVDDFNGALHDINNAVGTGLTGTYHNAEAILDNIRETIVRTGHDIEAAWDTSWHAVEHATDVARETLINIGHDIEHDWDTTWSHVVSYAEGIPGKIKHVFDGAASWLRSAGRNMIDGLINGMASLHGSLVSEAESLGKDAIHAAMSALGIHSPSAEFYDIGTKTVQGFVLGLKGGKSAVSALEDEIATASKQLGITGANAAYEAASQIDNGLAAGLRSELKTVDAEMNRVADELVNSLKRALRISSPSQATMEIGSQVVDGLVQGIDARQSAVSAAMGRLGNSALTGYLPNRSAGSSGAEPIVIHLVQDQPIVVGGKTLARVNQKYTLQHARRNTKSGYQLRGRGV